MKLSSQMIAIKLSHHLEKTTIMHHENSIYS
jgi:hypothetical protein